MYLGKVVTALSALNKKQLGRLEDYVASPYFDVPQASRSLLAYLKGLYPAFDERKIQVEVIAKKDKTLRTEAIQKKAGSELLKAIENFMAQEEWQSGLYDVSYYKAQALRKAHLFDQFDRECENAIAHIEKNPEPDVITFEYRHLFYELLTNSFAGRMPVNNREDDLQYVFGTLDVYYAIKTLRYLCEAVHRENTFGIPCPPVDAEKLITILKPFTNHKHPYVNLFVNAYSMLTLPDYAQSRVHYQLIKDEIQKGLREPLPRSIQEVIHYCRFWCLHWANATGSFDARKDYLYLVELQMDYNLLAERGKIMPLAFANALSNAAVVNRPAAWIKKFIDAYAPLLPEGQKQYAAFGLSLYYRAAKNYTESIRHIRLALQKEEVLFYASLRRWEFMILYEAGDTDAGQLLNNLDAYRKFLTRHANELKTYVSKFEPFINYCTLLVKGKLNSHNKEFKHAPYFPGKEWVEEQLK
jgi:hypothetical protein